MTTDLIIIGGGPAGLATSIFAAARGLSCVVLEARGKPLDKACGEGLMPAGVAALREMGVELSPESSHPFVGLRFVDRGLVAEARFRSPAGIGVARTALSGALVRRAEKLGVEIRQPDRALDWSVSDGGVRVTTPAGRIDARFLIGADGLRSRVRQQAGLDRVWSGRPRYGVRRHYRMRPWSSLVEVHWSRDAEFYVTPVSPDRVGVALLWSGSGGGFDTQLARLPELRARLEAGVSDGDDRGAGPFRQAASRRHAERIALVGDAAGYLDALTGEGLTLAFGCARSLADTLARGAPLAEYELAYRNLSRTYYRATMLLLAIAARPGARRGLMRLLARVPGLFDRLLAWNAGEWSGARPSERIEVYDSQHDSIRGGA